MIGLRHSLFVLTGRMLWQETEAYLVYRFARVAKALKQIEYIDRFCTTVSPSGGGVSKARAPALAAALGGLALVLQARIQRKR